MLSLMLIAPACEVSAQKMSRAIKKEYKSKLKQFKNEQWELYGSSRTFEVLLSKYYQDLNDNPNAREIIGYANKCQSKSVGHQTATNDACRTYAQQCGSKVKGRIDSDLASDGNDVSSEFDHFYAAYERLVEKEITGELQERFTICRQNGVDAKGNPTYEMQSFFIVDEDAASKARVKAYQNALMESESAQKYASQIDGFVKEGI